MKKNAGGKAKAQELALKGPGVEIPKDKTLDALGDKFIEIRDDKAKLATDLKEAEKKIIDRMREKNIPVYRFGDQEIRIKLGSEHVKIKTVKVDGAQESETNPEGGEGGK